MTRWWHPQYRGHADRERTRDQQRGGGHEEVLPRLLVVDDDRAIRETLRFLLEDAGYDVSEAPDGLAALRYLRESVGSVIVLLDMMMPQLDGIGVLRAVADDPRTARRCAFIMITAGTQTLPLQLERLLSHLNVPDVPVVRKPFDIDELLVVIERVVARLCVVRSRATNPLPWLEDELAQASG